ncbi:MAG: isoprenylcysteine carboxylmethyltransferase family protein [Acidobacteria bacterium]|nr:isoprenylcysteine carboxylmethyltransferase family protein [Acidobacteriota bacterium]
MTRAAVGSAVFFVVAPATVAGWIPWWISRWETGRSFPGSDLLRAVGVVLVLCGIPVLVDSFVRFAREGLGTPAPIAPTEHLVVSGWYRYVRNPMYVAVLSLVFGQALLFGNWTLVEYGAVLWVFFHLFVTGYEERVLRRKYGAEYDRFMANVPRWIPRYTGVK